MVRKRIGMPPIPLAPVKTIDLFLPMRAALLDLLRALDPADWERPTVCKGWTVKDVALHIFGDDVGLISRGRDGHRLPADVDGWDELVAFINRWNAQWVEALRRMSAPLLIELLTVTGEPLHAYFRSLDPLATGGPVSWAGPGPAPVWLDLAREYSEYWLHQQHIRDAVNCPGLTEPRFLGPLLATFVHAVPHTLREVVVPMGTLVKLVIDGEAGGQWHIIRGENGWGIYADSDAYPACVVTIDADLAWRRFTKGVGIKDAVEKARIQGDDSLGLMVLDTVAIIA